MASRDSPSRAGVRAAARRRSLHRSGSFRFHTGTKRAFAPCRAPPRVPRGRREYRRDGRSIRRRKNCVLPCQCHPPAVAGVQAIGVLAQCLDYRPQITNDSMVRTGFSVRKRDSGDNRVHSDPAHRGPRTRRSMRRRVPCRAPSRCKAPTPFQSRGTGRGARTGMSRRHRTMSYRD